MLYRIKTVINNYIDNTCKVTVELFENRGVMEVIVSKINLGLTENYSLDSEELFIRVGQELNKAGFEVIVPNASTDQPSGV